MRDKTNAHSGVVAKSKKRNHYEDLGVDGKIITRDLKEIRRKGFEWIHVAQCKHKREAVVNT